MCSRVLQCAPVCSYVLPCAPVGSIVLPCASVCSHYSCVLLCAPLCTCVHQCALMCSSLLSCAVHHYAPICSCVLLFAPMCTNILPCAPLYLCVCSCLLPCAPVRINEIRVYLCIYFVKLCICSWYLRLAMDYDVQCQLHLYLSVFVFCASYAPMALCSVHPVLCPQLRLRGQINGIFFVPSSHQFCDVLSDSKSLSSLSLASPAIRFRHHSNTIYFYKSAINF